MNQDLFVLYKKVTKLYFYLVWSFLIKITANILK